jgi:choline dehydrogenase-like flavoprotein
MKVREDQQRIRNGLHGQGGPVAAYDPPAVHPVTRAMIQACTQAGMEAVDKSLFEKYPNMAITPTELLKYEQLRDLGNGMKAFSRTVSEVMAAK